MERTSQTTMWTLILVIGGLYLGWRWHTHRPTFRYRKLDAEMDALRAVMGQPSIDA